ncbi:hypothetical protein [Nonomuraea sp. NPDC049695]|uniref:hypothetical protein n=1 Tax=Nonomuraea sp. NPDC049695 TaxID=3154734 RepID=UPI00342B4FC7
MNRIRLGKRGLIVLVSVILAAVIGSVGLAVANPYSSASNEATCAVWETPGTPGYEQCLDNLNASGQSGLVPGSTPGSSTAPTISATSWDDGSHPPNYFCLDSGKSRYATTKPIKGCKKQLVCLWKATDGKYHCVDGNGKSVDPPGGICQPGRNPHYACADEDPVVSVITPEIGQPTSSPPDNTQPTTTPPILASNPATADPTIEPTPDQPTATPSTTTTPTPTPPPTQAIDPSDPVAQALEQARAQGLRVWLETDLVNTWKRGPEQLKAAAERLKLFANQPGVVGVKFAYDLGLRGFTDANQIIQFVSETSQALRTALPAGRKIAIDVVIPELGCGTNQMCVQAMQQAYPLLTLANAEKYVLTGAIDAVNITGSLFTSQYATSKIQPGAAITNLWQRLRLLSWKTRLPGLYIGSRELGLAHAGPDSKVSPADANRLAGDRIDSPLRTGADHVILWTWKQTFNGQTWRLADQGARSNNIWNALRARKGLRALSVTYNPREPESSVAGDMKAIADIASAIYIYVP